MKDAARRMLIERLIPFWAGLRDAEHGGFYGWMDYELRVDREAVKGCILNSRILWFFSEAARLTGSETARECADHAYRFMTERCFDREHGGLYWSVTYDGRPDDTTKHTYNQAFGIYALSAYHRLTGDADALAAAWSLYDVIEGHCSDAGGYLEAFTRDWGPESNEKLSENGVMAQRTMNTLLHVFEGYSGLYEVTRDPRAERALRRMLDIYAEKVFDPVRDRQRVFFDLDYNSTVARTCWGMRRCPSASTPSTAAWPGTSTPAPTGTTACSTSASGAWTTPGASGGSRPRRCWASSTSIKRAAT